MRWETGVLVPVFVVLMMVGLGCGGGPLKRVRAATYAPDFHYITKQEIRTTMGTLAAQLDTLDRIMWQVGGPRPEDRTEINEILSRMQVLATQLKRREQSNHPRIHAHASRLQRDIERALVSMGKEPPNYYFAGVISGACSYCHAPGHHSRAAASER